MLKKIIVDLIKIIRTTANEKPEILSVSMNEKICNGCGGSGTGLFGSGICGDCNGSGVVRKSYNEYVNTLPEK